MGENVSKQFYKHFEFRAPALAMIDIMNEICEDYMGQGFVLTVRQLYYQLVARGHIENTERSYKRTTGLVNDARLAGLMDWDAIEDLAREDGPAWLSLRPSGPRRRDYKPGQPPRLPPA